MENLKERKEAEGKRSRRRRGAIMNCEL